MVANTVKLIECPRDAMQGWSHFIPTNQKVAYIQQLLNVGFDTIDFGSFVSPKAIPQMADTRDVVAQLDISRTPTKLLAIVANERGAADAVQFDPIQYLGFPFSVSETFQQLNTNASIDDAFDKVTSIQEMCVKYSKNLVVYISMGFGNPYGDVYHEDLVFQWVHKLTELGISIISLADTVGLASPKEVSSVAKQLIAGLPNIEFGVHLHSDVSNWKEKVDAALEAGCNRFDAAMRGIGGCPMSGSALVGNMNTELLVPYFQQFGLLDAIDEKAMKDSQSMAATLFN